MNGHLWAGFVNHTVIAHGAHKRNFLPIAKDSVAYVVLGLITNPLKIISLVAHVNPYAVGPTLGTL